MKHAYLPMINHCLIGITSVSIIMFPNVNLGVVNPGLFNLNGTIFVADSHYLGGSPSLIDQRCRIQVDNIYPLAI